MLYIIEDHQKLTIVTGTDFESGMDKKGYYKQLYNKYHAPLILNDGDCELGRQAMIHEIYRRGIDMNRHRLCVLYLDTRKCKAINRNVRQELKKLREEFGRE